MLKKHPVKPTRKFKKWEHCVLLPEDLVILNPMEFGHKYTHSSALKKLTFKSGNHLIEECSYVL
jgi:hypothetical protein